MTGSPKFDLSNLSWRESKALALLQLRIQEAQATRDVGGLEAAFGQMEQFLSRVVVSVPADWLVASAPEALDWSDPGSFNALKAARMKDLMQALALAQSPEEASKN